MDFFEKAHVYRKRKSQLPQQSKLKTKFKHMLLGYKNNDNSAIKRSLDSTINLDDNLSQLLETTLESESDFDITNIDHKEKEAGVKDLSSPEGSVHCTSSEHADSSDVDNNSDLADSNKKNINKMGSIESPLESSNKIWSPTEQAESSSGNDEESDLDIQQLSNNNKVVGNEAEYETSSDSFAHSVNSSCVLDENISIESAHSSDESDLYCEFDPDKKLAKQILKKIKNKSKTKVPSEGILKISVDDDNEVEIKSTSEDEEIGAVSHISSEAQTISPPFVSVATNHTPLQGLDELFATYKYSTVKNLSVDRRDEIIFPTENSTILSSAVVNQADMDMEELSEEESLDPPEEDFYDESSDREIDFNIQTLNSFDETIDSDGEVDLELPITSPVKVYKLKESCVFVLKHPVELFVHGKIKVASLCGTVDVLGHRLNDTPCELYAPNYNIALNLKSIDQENNQYGLFNKLSTVGLSVAETEELVTTLGVFDAVLHLEPLKSKKLDYLERTFKVADLFRKKNKNTEDCFYEACNILGCSLYLTKPRKRFEEGPDWLRVVNLGFAKNSKGIICGGKGTGKSTYMRYYINKLVHNGPVLVIDLDPGQSEFTVAGNVSATVVKTPLLGPNFTHLQTPVRMLNIGMINVLDNLERYITAISDILRFCENTPDLQNLPWVVNTMGMCNTLGFKILAFIILRLNPTFVVQMDSSLPKKRFDETPNSAAIINLYSRSYNKDPMFEDIVVSKYFDYNFFKLSFPSEGNGRANTFASPKDERYLNFLSYFGEMLNHVTCTSLLGVRPYKVNLNALKFATNCRVDEGSINKVINGKIVGLCAASPLDRAGTTYTLDEKVLLCYGYGVVRGVDMEHGYLYLTTPLNLEMLRLVSTLVYSDITPDLLAAECSLPPGTALPYCTSAAPDHHKHLMKTPKRRFNPLQLLKMSRGSSPKKSNE